MSRTYRKNLSGWYYSQYSNLESYMKHQSYRLYTAVHVYKTDEEYEEEYKAAKKADPFSKPYISRVKYWYWRERTQEEIQHDKELDEAEYLKLTRDGRAGRSTRRRDFKLDCNRSMRRANKKFCHDVMTDQWEDNPYPIRHETDFKVWRYW